MVNQPLNGSKRLTGGHWEVIGCDAEGISVGVRGERLIGFESVVVEKAGGEWTPESSPVLLIPCVGRTVGIEDSGALVKGIKSIVMDSLESRGSMDRS